MTVVRTIYLTFVFRNVEKTFSFYIRAEDKEKVVTMIDQHLLSSDRIGQMKFLDWKDREIYVDSNEVVALFFDPVENKIYEEEENIQGRE